MPRVGRRSSRSLAHGRAAHCILRAAMEETLQWPHRRKLLFNARSDRTESWLGTCKRHQEQLWHGLFSCITTTQAGLYNGLGRGGPPEGHARWRPSSRRREPKPRNPRAPKQPRCGVRHHPFHVTKMAEARSRRTNQSPYRRRGPSHPSGTPAPKQQPGDPSYTTWLEGSTGPLRGGQAQGVVDGKRGRHNLSGVKGRLTACSRGRYGGSAEGSTLICGLVRKLSDDVRSPLETAPKLARPLDAKASVAKAIKIAKSANFGKVLGNFRKPCSFL